MKNDVIRLAHSVKPIKISLARGGRPKKSAVNKQTAAFNAKTMSDEEYSKLLRSMGLRSERDPEISLMNMFFGNNDELMGGLKNRNQQYGLRQQQTDLFPDLPDDDVPNKSNGGELKDPTKRAAFASLFTPRETNLPATVGSPVPAPATPEDKTALANRSFSSGPVSAENSDLIAKATQTLMEAPVTRRKFLETSRNAVAAANQAPTISKLLKPTKIAKAVAKKPMGEGAKKFLIRHLLSEPVSLEHPIVKGLLNSDEELYPDYYDVDPEDFPGMEHLTSDEATEELIQSSPRRAIDLIHGGGDTVSYMDPEKENEIYERTHAHLKSKFENLTGEKISDEEYKNLVSDAENNYSGNGDFIDDLPDIKKSKGGDVALNKAKRDTLEKNATEWHKNAHPSLKNKDGSPKTFYHAGTFGYDEKWTPNFKKTENEVMHFGTKRAAKDRQKSLAEDVLEKEDIKKIKMTPVYLNLKNPMMYNDDDGEDWADTIRKAKSAGHDGIIYPNHYEDVGSKSVMAFYPNQIKHAEDNNGDFDSSNPDIKKSEGGLIHKESGGSLAARRAEAQAYIKDLIEQRKLYAKGSPEYDFYTKQIAEQGKIVAQKAEPDRSIGMGHNQPPEETAPEKLDRNYNALGLYSRAAEAARSSKQDEMKLKEWAKFLKNQTGVKEEELKWGLKNLAKIKPFPVDGEPEEDPSDEKFSKDEIASAFENESFEGYKKSVRSGRLREKYMKDPEYYHNNWESSYYYDSAHAAVMAEEMSKDPKAIEHYFSKLGYDKNDIDDIASDFKRNQDYVDEYGKEKGYSEDQLEKAKNENAANFWVENYKNELRSIARSENPKWTKYQLSNEKEGVKPLENYREIIPQYRPEEKERFTYETHFPEKNPLFHLRLGDRKTPDGKKILEVVEAQSDAAQQGRGKFLNDETHQRLQNEYASLNEAHADAYFKLKEALQEQEKLQYELYAKIRDTQGSEAASQAMDADYPGTDYPKLAMKIDILSNQKDKIRQELDKTQSKLENVISEYPHVTSSNAITNLMIKQILHEVAAGDYDGVTVNHGPTQAARWPSKEGEAVGKWYDTTFIPKLYDAMKSHDPETLHYGPHFVPRTLEDKDGEPVLDPKSGEPIDLWKTKGLSESTPTNKGFSVSSKNVQSNRNEAGLDYYFNDDIHGYGNSAPLRMQLRQNVQNWHYQQHPDVHESPEAVRVTGSAIADYLDANKIPYPKKDDTQQPLIEASPTAKASILKNQTLYKRGGAVIPHDDPRRNENLAAFQKGNHPDVPHIMYHGTKYGNIREFSGFLGSAGHFAFDPKAAYDYTGLESGYHGEETPYKNKQWHEEGPQIYPVHISAKKLFDARKKEHIDALNSLKEKDIINLPRKWDHETFEKYVPLIKKAGFDSYLDFEKNLSDPPQGIAVFYPHQIKSAIGNKGTFDPSKSDINEARGGRIGYDEGGDVRTGDNPGGAADAARPAGTSRDAEQNYNAGSGTQTAGPSGGDQTNDRFNIGGGGAPLPPQRSEESMFGNMGGNIGSLLGGLALGPLGAIGGRYLGNQFNQPENSQFTPTHDEFGNPVGGGGGWLDFLGGSKAPPAPTNKELYGGKDRPLVNPINPRKRKILMPDGTYQETDQYKVGGEVKSSIAKTKKTEHNSPIVEVALSKIRSLPRSTDYPSRGMRGRP